MTFDEERRRQAMEYAIRTRVRGSTPDDIIVAARKYYEFLTKKEN